MHVKLIVIAKLCAIGKNKESESNCFREKLPC